MSKKGNASLVEFLMSWRLTLLAGPMRSFRTVIGRSSRRAQQSWKEQLAF
jgi:hypothetical protein